MAAKTRTVAAAVAAMAICMSAPVQAQPDQGGTRQVQSQDHVKTLQGVVEILRRNHVDVSEERKLIEGAIKGMLGALDERSTYYSAEDFRRQREATKGEFGGLGVEVLLKDGVIQVVTPIDGTPAARAGLRAGDAITQVNDKPLKGLSLPESVAEMRGPVGTTAKLTVVRPGTAEPLSIEIVREVIRVISVRTRADEDVGYIRISTFNSQTAAQFREGVRTLTEQIGQDRLKGFIIDLRNCSGGLLDAVVAVADDLLEQGIIVTTAGRRPADTGRREAKPGDITGGKNVVVLINGGTASGAEIVAGALRDHRRASIVGTRSFGSGTVASIFPIDELGGAISLITARFATPSGRLIEGLGIEPDHLVEQDPPAGAPTVPRSALSAYVPAETNKDKQLLFALDLARSGKRPGPN
jgi:carboxyl-terminal processing protease